jgi:hypothetical protein
VKMTSMSYRNAGTIVGEMKANIGIRFMFKLCLYCQSREHAGRDCKKTQFKKGSCCWTCGLPQKAYGKDIHGNVRTGECSDVVGLRDIVRGGCWALYRREIWLRMWLNGKNIQWMSEERFREWIGLMEFEGEITNGVRTILCAWRNKVHI